jgi:hypothetical protein
LKRNALPECSVPAGLARLRSERDEPDQDDGGQREQAAHQRTCTFTIREHAPQNCFRS